MLTEGRNPSSVRKENHAAVASRKSFKDVAEKYLGKQAKLTEGTIRQYLTVFQRDIFPFIGDRAIQAVTRADIKKVLDAIVERGAVSTATTAAILLNKVFVQADILGLVTVNPVGAIRKTLPERRAKNFKAITDPAALAGLLRAIDGYQGTPAVRAALKLAPMLACRPGELRTMEWSHVNLDDAEWRYEVSKVRRLHIVPLPRQAVEILRDLQPLTGHGRWVFPNPHYGSDRAMSANATLAAIRLMGFGPDTVVPHGFRATFRTLGEEVLGLRPDLLEMQLSHKIKNPLGRVYSRGEFLADRREMMQKWADYLDSLKAQGRVKATA